MLSFFAVGSAEIPPLNPGDTADVVLELDRPMANDEYTVSILKPGAVTAVATELSTDSVVVQVAAENGFAGTAEVHVICIQ